MICDKLLYFSFVFSLLSFNVDNQDNIIIFFVVFSCFINKGYLVFDEQLKVFDSLIKKGIKNSIVNIEVFLEFVLDF